MIINEFIENGDIDTYSKIQKKTENDDSEIQKIKKQLDKTYLRYISNNLKKLLDMDIINDNKCFEKSDSNENIEKYRVILYIRLSVEDGDVVDGDVSRSIRNQLLILLDECNKRDWKIVGIFCEDGISGTDDNRQEWRKCLKFCECRNTEIVLCKSQSRFSRSMEMIEKYLHKEFINWNIRFVGLIDNTDTAILSNKKARQINGLVNEWQVEDQSINIRAVLKNKQSNGLFTGSFAPYGYKKNPKDKYHLIIDEDAAKIVQKIFSMYIEGKGVTNICRYLNENKIPIPSIYKYEKGLKYNNCKIKPNKRIIYQVEEGDTISKIANKYQSTVKDIMQYNCLSKETLQINQVITIPVKYVWRTNTIYQILKNEVYIGTLIQHKNENISYKSKKQRRIAKEERISVPHCHSAIIDKKTWDIAKSKLEKRKRLKTMKDGEISLFSGKVRCGACGHSFYRNPKTIKNKKFVYWICSNRYKTAGSLCNNRKTLKEEELYKIILNEINKQIEIYYDKDIIRKKYYELKRKNSLEQKLQGIMKEKSDIEMKINKKESVLELLYEDRINGIIDMKEFLTLKDKNNMQLDNYKLRINEIDVQLEKLSKKKTVKEDIEKILNKYTKLQKLDRNIIEEFICQINIGNYNTQNQKREIKIQWNINSCA